MAFVWLFAILTLMAGSSQEREPKRVKSEKDQTESSRQGLEFPAESESEDSTDNKDDDKAEETAVQEEQPVISPIREYTGEGRARSRDEQFTESFFSPHSGHLIPLRYEEMTAPSRPSIAHEGESSRHTPSLSSIHREQQQLIAELAELEAKVMRFSTEIRDAVKELQSINKMVKKIFLKIGCTLSDVSDSD